jgi:hypothetical protein
MWLKPFRACVADHRGVLAACRVEEPTLVETIFRLQSISYQDILRL